MRGWYESSNIVSDVMSQASDQTQVYQAPPAYQPTDPRPAAEADILFLGSPGTGKSTFSTLR